MHLFYLLATSGRLLTIIISNGLYAHDIACRMHVHTIVLKRGSGTAMNLNVGVAIGSGTGLKGPGSLCQYSRINDELLDLSL